jgi:anaerobic selenocysteine-containing dehydrogenase
VRNVARFSPPVTPLAEGALDESDILLRLIAILSGRGPQAATDGPAEMRRRLDNRLSQGPYGLSLDKLEAAEHGVDLGPLLPRIPEILRTASGRIELCPAPIAAALAELRAPEPVPANSFVVVGRRHVRTNNSWMHNVPALVKGKPLCTIQVNALDAERLGLVPGGRARVTSRVGEVELPVEITDEIAPGVVSIPHGFGHDLPGVEMSVARRSAGVNTNLLTDDLSIDPLSGTAVLNGVPVEVAPA